MEIANIFTLKHPLGYMSTTPHCTEKKIYITVCRCATDLTAAGLDVQTRLSLTTESRKTVKFHETKMQPSSQRLALPRSIGARAELHAVGPVGSGQHRHVPGTSTGCYTLPSAVTTVILISGGRRFVRLGKFQVALLLRCSKPGASLAANGR